MKMMILSLLIQIYPVKADDLHIHKPHKKSFTYGCYKALMIESQAQGVVVDIPYHNFIVRHCNNIYEVDFPTKHKKLPFKPEQDNSNPII